MAVMTNSNVSSGLRATTADARRRVPCLEQILETPLPLSPNTERRLIDPAGHGTDASVADPALTVLTELTVLAGFHFGDPDQGNQSAGIPCCI